MKSQFIEATWINGTGVDSSGNVLKNAMTVNLGSDTGQICHGQYPDGAIGRGALGGNTFKTVSSITGSCPHQKLVMDQSLAMPVSIIHKRSVPATLSGVKALSCGDQLNLDIGEHTTTYTRFVDDMCPRCSISTTFYNGSDGHIDAFSSDTSCTGKLVGDFGYFYTSYPTN